MNRTKIISVPATPQFVQQLRVVAAENNFLLAPFIRKILEDFIEEKNSGSDEKNLAEKNSDPGVTRNQAN